MTPFLPVRRRRTVPGLLALALALAGAGCGGTDDGRAAARPAGGTDAIFRLEATGTLPVPLGDSSLSGQVHGLTLLVVGDSWARNLGVGAAEADREQRNTVVNAGLPGCGVMQPVRIRMHGRLVPAPKNCNDWPQRWQALIARYRPAAVLLEVGYWDGQDSQQLPGQKDVSSIKDASYRARFDRQMDQAIHLLGSAGARVYLPTVIDNDDFARADSDAMNAAIRAAVQRNPGSRLLDLHDQLCTRAKVCPENVAGVAVYDETRHPSPAVRVRLGAWILDSVYADLAAARGR